MEKLIHFNVFEEFEMNVCFFCAFFSWCTAQATKLIICFVKTGKINLRYFVSTGEMPSAHSATVSGLATSIGLVCGFDTPLFAMATTFAIITMFDASTVRYAAGQQAAVINKMVSKTQDESFGNVRLKEVLGHTRLEVLMGMLVGIVFSCAFVSVWMRCV